MNYFELYNLETSYAVDTAQLAQTYQSLQKLTHPDKFATASEREKLLAVQKNSQVNDAYQVLKSPIARAEHLLELRGIELKHEQQTMQNGAFLMQQMEWREQLAEISPQSQADSLDELEALDDDVQAVLKQSLTTLQTLLDKAQAEADIQAAQEVRKLKFLVKLRKEIALKEEQLSDV